MRIALGQINTRVGDFTGNSTKIIEYAQRARSAGADLVVFPELSVCGYPPRDLVERPWFVERNQRATEEDCVSYHWHRHYLWPGYPGKLRDRQVGSQFRCAATRRKNNLLQSKRLLPTYDVFDEMRNFAPADRQQLPVTCGTPVALTICEDAWNDKTFLGPQALRCRSGRGFNRRGWKVAVEHLGFAFLLRKRELRRDMLAAIATHYRVPVAVVNQVGGNDSLVFDGSSFALGPDGQIIAQAKSFAEDLICFDSETLSGDIQSAG